jgi:signal transduction histidine kinase
MRGSKTTVPQRETRAPAREKPRNVITATETPPRSRRGGDPRPVMEHGVCGRPETSGQTCALHLLQHGIFTNLSHELLTPITAIQGYLSLLTQGVFGPLAGEQEAAVHVALTNTDRLHGMIGDLLDYASLNRDLLALALEPVDLCEVLAAAVQRITGEAAARQVVITHRLPASLGVISGDRRRLIRAFEHLLENAAKFSAPGQHIYLTALRRDATVRITVRDQGIGMTPELLARAFMPFMQGENGLTRQYNGLGLGLPLVHKLITLHGGRLSIRSARDRGTAVTVILPECTA